MVEKMSEFENNQVNENEATPVAEPVAEPVVDSVAEKVVAEPVVVEDGFATADFDAPKKPKKGKKAIIIIAIIVVVLGLIGGAIALFWNSIAGFFIKNFGSDEDYLKFVEYNALSAYVDDVAMVYGNATESFTEGTATNVALNVEVSDTAHDLLKEYLAADVSWLKSISLEGNTKTDGDLQSTDAILKLSGKEILNASVIVDQAEGKAYLAILNLSEKYMEEKIQIPEAYKELLSEEFIAKLPAEKDFSNITKRYLEIALDNLNDVEKSTETVEIGDVSQKLTVLELTISEKDLYDICMDVLKEFKNDKEVKNIIKGVLKQLEDEGLIDDANDALDELYDELDEAIDNLKEADVDSDKEMAVLTDYVNSKHEIVGRTLSVGGRKALEYLKATDGDEFAYELDYSGAMKVKGEGTIKSDIVNATYTVTVQNIEVATLTVEDFDEAAFDDGYINGKFTVKPSEELLSQVIPDSQINSVIKLLDPGVCVDINTGKDNGSIKVSLLSKDQVLVTVSASGTVSDDNSISVPDDSDVVSQDEWASELDINKIIDALKEAGVPTELLNVLNYYMQ